MGTDEIAQCQFFVVRKKRLCRMTVKPGRNFCGEHEPQPKIDSGDSDVRIPCPYDPKHTCYESKLEKHLSICNARQGEIPPYIVHDINCSTNANDATKIPLSSYSKQELKDVINKVNFLYENDVEHNMTSVPEQEIHSSVLEEFSEPNRTETSRRHLRQASSLLHIVEQEGLVHKQTSYLELGAGKGQLSYFARRAWCGGDTDSSTVLVERAAVRHKRDARHAGDTPPVTRRLRADLAHLRLDAALDARCRHVLALAKHLCGVATDYGLRCVTSPGVAARVRGAVLATCCHHRLEPRHYVASDHMQKLGISMKDMNILVGMVSWATCGDGRSRERRRTRPDVTNTASNSENREPELSTGTRAEDDDSPTLLLSKEYKETIGKRAKCLLDWGRVLYLRDKGFEAKLVYYVDSSVSLENVCIVAKKCIS